MAGDNHIWKSEQPREHVVAKNQPRTILKEDFFFLLINVETEVTDLAALQRLVNRKCIQQGTATGVDQHDAGFHSGDRGATNEMLVFRRERAVQRNDIRLCEQFVHLDVSHAERLTDRIWKWIERQSWATESGENLRHHAPNLARADHANCFSVHVESDQALESEIAFSDAIICAMKFSVERQHKSDGVLGY